jgi:hypothetical protein
MDEIPKVVIPPSTSRKKDMALADNGTNRSIYRYLTITEDNGFLAGKKLETSYQRLSEPLLYGRGFYTFF